MNGKLKTTSVLLFFVLAVLPAYGQKAKDGSRYKDIVYEPGYEHDKWKTTPRDHVFEFRAFATSFDGNDDNDGNGTPDRWGIPEWVSFDVRKKTMKVKANRPGEWMSEESLYALDKRVAPKDDSYHFAQQTKKDHPYSLTHDLSRGHMCPKNTANRLGKNADYNTHTVLNACPQKQWHNNGIWKDLERLTENWADEHGKVWVICGPVFHKRKPRLWLGEAEKGETTVAIPDAFFKIIIRESEDPNAPQILAFIYPHAIKPSENRRKSKAEGYPHHKFLVSVDHIEKHTGLDFFSSLTDGQQKVIEEQAAEEVWDDPGEYKLLD